MISAIDFLKEYRDICDSHNCDCSVSCPLFYSCLLSPDELTDENILEIVKFCRERKEERERNQNN